MAPKIVLYTRQKCPLCDEAAELLVRYGLSFESVDIDNDVRLREQFDLCVPVIKVDDRVRFRGRINEVLLRRLLVKA